MPRNTRAAARAQEAEPEIATDDTATDGPEDPVKGADEEQRPALIELTSNAINEVEVAIEAVNEKTDGKNAKATVRTGRKTKRGTKKGIKKAEVKEAIDTPKNDEDVHPKISEPETSAASDTSPSVSSSSTPSETDTSGRTFANHPDDKKTDIDGNAPQEDNLQNAVSPQASPTTSPADTAAAQQLQALFQKPVENEADPISPLVEAASQPLPLSPAVQDVITERKALCVASPSKGATDAESPQVAPSTGRNEQPTVSKVATKAKTDRSSTLALSRVSSVASKPPAVDRRNSKSMSQSKVATSQSPTEGSKPRSSIAALHTPPKAVKSNKPLTKPTFALPSDALREKLKAQKEERQKRQEQAAARMADKKEPSGITIKPARKPVNDNKSRAPSLANPTPKTIKTGTVSRTPAKRSGGLEQEKRSSTLVHRSRPSATQLRHTNGSETQKRKSSAPLVRENKASALRRTGSVSRPSSVLPKAPEKPKSEPKPEPEVEAKKEIKPFDRGAAAKKARAEAAEKGRAASREWAEKKKKEMETKKLASVVPGEKDLAVHDKENANPVALEA